MIFEVPDIMTFLKDKYLVYMANRPKPNDDTPSLDGFIDFARKYLAEENQPLNVAYLPVGLGLRLQQGETIGFIANRSEQAQMRDEGIPITRPRVIPGMHGISDTSCVPISGGR